jgi:NTP pyrophosphatase (non-canonical NTP hydrolase)
MEQIYTKDGLHTYQWESRATWAQIDCGVNPDIDTYCVLGLANEVGELLGKIKKLFRDKNGDFSEEDRESVKQELGDVLWYWTQIATSFGLTIDEIAEANLTKVLDRQRRGVLGGSGDNR